VIHRGILCKWKLISISGLLREKVIRFNVGQGCKKRARGVSLRRNRTLQICRTREPTGRRDDVEEGLKKNYTLAGK